MVSLCGEREGEVEKGVFFLGTDDKRKVADADLECGFRDPSFIREFKAKHCVEAFVEHVVQKKK